MKFGMNFIRGLVSVLLLAAYLFTGESAFIFATVVPWTEGYDTNGSPGKRAKTGSFQERTKVAEETIKFGLPLGLGTTGEQVKILSSATDIFAGIAVWNPHALGVESAQYNQNEPAVIAYEGIYWVKVDEGVNEKDVVRARIINHASDVTKLKGNFCKTVDAGKTVVLKGAYWDGSRTDAGMIPLRLSDSIEIIEDEV
jgi:hypothetical protein